MRQTIQQMRNVVLTVLLLALTCLTALADTPIKVNMSLDDNGNAIVSTVTNNTEDQIVVFLYKWAGDPRSKILNAGETYNFNHQTCTKITYQSEGRTATYWQKSVSRADDTKDDASHTMEAPPIPTKSKNESKKTVDQAPVIKEQVEEIIPRGYVGRRDKQTILNTFEEYLNSTRYYCKDGIAEEFEQIEQSIEDLNSDLVEDPVRYVSVLSSSMKMMEDNLSRNRDRLDQFIDNYLGGFTTRDREATRSDMVSMMNDRLEKREANLNLLRDALQQWEKTQKAKKMNWPLVGLLIGLAALATALAIWFLKARKRAPRRTRRQVYQPVSAQEASSAIVVRRKTTSILKKQSLENVIDNPAYLAIDCQDFCQQSAVRRIYFKNSCIKEIYNMYAEDLRNPENPKEDGCMVLGRWVYDNESNEYYVSLEHVVMPGDDAIFSEYELNFGGKIKLKVSERLRKLRRETDLQYDMTCWVHSHPGLGVFFSNSDANVQNQLKHPTHPRFLTAIVVDILTPRQEMGIFTFKPDGSINAKADLTRLYSLEELYKWAIESERNTFKADDFFNTLSQSNAHDNDCYGIHLSNGAIIDMDRLIVESDDTGLIGLAHGYVQREGVRNHVAINAVSSQEVLPDNELIGCFVKAKFCSIPTVKKATAAYLDKVRFVLVYSSTDGMVTTIPVRNNELCTDENYYGENKFDELKIWTRRKR